MIRDYSEVTITTAASTVSTVALLDDRVLVGAFLPATFDGTTILFQAGYLPPGVATPKDDFTSTANFTFFDLYDTANTKVSYTVASSRYVAFPRGTFDGIRALKVVTGTAQTTTDTIITLVLMPLGG